ncbi:MAG: hypothetical protein ACFHX7_12285 [Pseudomonadota bacterium]
MTDAGRAAFEKFDPALLPANNCQSPGLPSIAMTPNLQLWEFADGQLKITHEYFSTERTVHFDPQKPANLKETHLGYATASLDDNTLTITTTALAPSWGGLSRNAPSSNARIVTERYTLSEDGQSITGTLTIEDKNFLQRTIELPLRLRRADAGTELVLFPCSIEASQRHLDQPQP